jgi:ClpP class serine protease
LDDLHSNFISVVRDSRGDKMSEELALAHVNSVAAAAGVEPIGDGLFDGSFYAGQQAVDLGFADSIGNLHSTVAERFGESAVIKQVKVGGTHPLSMLLPGLAAGGGGGVAADAVSAAAGQLKDQMWWNTFGLEMPR